MMTIFKKLLFAAALALGVGSASAKDLGEYVCAKCYYSSPNATQSQVDTAVRFVNDNFPVTWRPSENDLVQVCNGDLCLRVKWDGEKWGGFATNIVMPDTVLSSGRNYINSTASGNGALSRRPLDNNGNNYIVTVEIGWVTRHNYGGVDGGPLEYQGSHDFPVVIGISWVPIGMAGVPGEAATNE